MERGVFGAHSEDVFERISSAQDQEQGSVIVHIPPTEEWFVLERNSNLSIVILIHAVGNNFSLIS